MQMPAAVESVIVEDSEGQSQSHLQSEERPAGGKCFQRPPVEQLWPKS